MRKIISGFLFLILINENILAVTLKSANNSKDKSSEIMLLNNQIMQLELLIQTKISAKMQLQSQTAPLPVNQVQKIISLKRLEDEINQLNKNKKQLLDKQKTITL